MSEATVLKTKPKSARDYFQNTKARRDFFAGEELAAYDAAEVISFEQGFAKCGLSHSPDGLPPISVLVAVWRKARNSWERVMKALPPGSSLRNAMLDELRDRDKAMEGLRAKARALLEAKIAKGECDG
jgi:hypothetical protein